MTTDLQADIEDYTLAVPDDDTLALTVWNAKGEKFAFNFDKRSFQRKFFAAFTPRKKHREMKRK